MNYVSTFAGNRARKSKSKIDRASVRSTFPLCIILKTKLERGQPPLPPSPMLHYPVTRSSTHYFNRIKPIRIATRLSRDGSVLQTIFRPTDWGQEWSRYCHRLSIRGSSNVIADPTETKKLCQMKKKKKGSTDVKTAIFSPSACGTQSK